MKNKVYIIFCLFICLKTFLKSIKIYHGDIFTINYGNASSFFACPNENWLQIGTYCFLPAFSKLSWEEASYTCNQPHLFYSYLLTTTETSIIKSLLNNIQQDDDYEFWNNWQSFDNDLNMTAKFSNKYLTLNKSSFTWSSTYNIEIAKLKQLSSYKSVKHKKLCTSVAKNNLTKENAYYKLNDCSTKKSFICETFSCFKDEFRCKDNSKCLPQIFLCNGYPDCPDNSDENDCTCSKNSIVTYNHKQKSGYITSPIKNIYNGDTDNCKWEIIQENDETIELTFLILNLKDNEFITISQPNNEGLYLNKNNITSLENTWRSKSNKLSITYNRNLLNSGSFNIFYKTLTLNDDVSYLNENNGNIYFHKIDFLPNEIFKRKWIINKNENEVMSLTITNLNHDSKTSFTIKLGNVILDKSFLFESKFLTTSLTSSTETIEIEMIAMGRRNVTIDFESFYQNSCISILHDLKNYGQIYSPDYHQPLTLKNISYDCSWVLNPSCAKSSTGCFLSIIPTINNIVNDSFVKFSTFKENFILNDVLSFQKIYTFHLSPNDSKIMIQMKSYSNNFKVKLSYSVNCYIPNNLNGLLIKSISQNSTNNKNIFPTTTKLVFECPNKQILTPITSLSIQCLIGGEWSSNFPKCIESMCPLPFIKNGYINHVEGYTLSSKLSFKCKLGYVSPNRNYTTFCNEEQIFYPKPVCKPIKCPSSKTSIFYNALDVKKNTCPFGFKLSFGSDISQCDLNGKWRYSLYYCEEVKCLQEIVDFSILTKPRLYKFNDTLEVDCLHGYEKNYDQNIICNEYGEWIDEEGRIVENIKCIKTINQSYSIDCNSIGGCRNEGTCIYQNGFKKCLCKQGFFGPNCQFKTSNCSINEIKQCSMNKNFLQFQHSYNKCTCYQNNLLQNNNLCKKNPCQNNGDCKIINDKNYYCKCPDGVIGKNCEQKYDICKIVGGSKGFCNGHGTCIVKNRKPFCECMFLWKGKHCETPIDICEKNKNYCLNGGKCLSLIGSSFPICKCKKMFYGNRCEEKVDYCQFEPCLHGGICTNSEYDGYSCLCRSSFMGNACHISRGICSNEPCQNGGICVSQNGTSYKCICSSQYTGPNCEQFVNLCLEYERNGISYCMNGGLCHSLRGENVLCECRDEYSGDKCQHKVDKNEKNYNLFFTPTKFYDFDYYSRYNKSIEISDVETNQQLIFSPIFRSSFLNETTICGWIKPDINEKEDTSFVVVGTYDGNKITKSIIHFSLTSVVLNYDKKVTINYKLIPNQWQHFCLRSPKLHKYKVTSWDFFYNGAILKSTNKGIEPLKITDRYLRILLGASLDGKLKYQGEMTLIEYYSNLLTDKEILDLATKCSYTGSRPPIVGWSDYSDSSKSNGLVVKIEPGLCSENTNDVTNNSLNLLYDDISYTPSYSLNINYTITIKNCSKDIYKYTNEDGAIVEWKPNTAQEIFKDYLNLKKLYVNFESGGYFKLGTYKIMYIGTNNFNINGLCQFNVNVLKNDT